MKRLACFFGLSLCALAISAQQYVVTSITGQVTCEQSGGEKKTLALRQNLSPKSILHLPYKAQVELLDEQARKKYVLKVPGKGLLSEMLKDRQNSAMQLTEQYLAYLKERVKSKGEMTSKRFSDPATVTREVAVKKSSFAEEFDIFRQNAFAKYEQFRQKSISDYASFMKNAWQSFDAQPPLQEPEYDKVEPEIAPEEPVETNTMMEVQVEGDPLAVADLDVSQVRPHQVREEKVTEGEYVDFEYYGTPMRVRFTNKELFKIDNLNEKSIAKAYERLKSSDYNNTIHDCIELRSRHQLSDWGYLKFLDVFSKACFSSADEATLLMAFIYQQSGYKMRLGVADNHLLMLFSSKHVIYKKSFFTIGDEYFYPYGTDAASMKICEAAYPEENSMSLWLQQPPLLAVDQSEERMLKSSRYEDFSVGVSVNRNMIAFFNDYPSSMIDGNALTRWAIYAKVPFEPQIAETLLPVLREKIEGLSEKEAVERLLNLVQTALVYKYDEDVWGADRAFFSEETLFYPYADCEDRSILLSRLVHDLLKLPTLLVYYPGHLAMAVGFTETVPGDGLLLNGKRYVVCDPTYVNSRVGTVMPKMVNKPAQVILME